MKLRLFEKTGLTIAFIRILTIKFANLISQITVANMEIYCNNCLITFFGKISSFSYALIQFDRQEKSLNYSKERIA